MSITSVQIYMDNGEKICFPVDEKELTEVQNTVNSGCERTTINNFTIFNSHICFIKYKKEDGES